MSSSSSSTAPKFVMCGNLSKLAKYLRVLGIDCAYDGGLALCDAIVIAQVEGRILIINQPFQTLPGLTSLCLNSDDLGDQIRQVINECGGTSSIEVFSRCLICNTTLSIDIPDTAIIPDSVRKRQLQVKHCPACLRNYWQGNHVSRMLMNLISLGVNLDRIQS
ncbi:Mut7-C RNAse domain-containing protein [Calditrichota bacterium]